MSYVNEKYENLKFRDLNIERGMTNNNVTGYYYL